MAKITVNDFPIKIEQNLENPDLRGLHIMIINPFSYKIVLAQTFDTN